MVLEVLMVPKAGLEPARISTVDFEYLSRAAMQATTR